VSNNTPEPGDIVRVTYTAVWAPEDDGHRTVLTGNDDRRRWRNVVPDNATIEVLRAAGESADASEPGLCLQNRRGDKAEPQPHYYHPQDSRCVFCHAPALQGGEVPRALRTPDGRVWTLAADKSEAGHALYEAPFVGSRYTAMALEQMHAEQGDVVMIPDPAPPYVFNARSVNRMVKHIPDGLGHTLCPSSFVASPPMAEEEAARLTLCRGCRRALLENLVQARPHCPGAAIDHDATGICAHA
jgi:hypothetical protein